MEIRSQNELTAMSHAYGFWKRSWDNVANYSPFDVHRLGERLALLNEQIANGVSIVEIEKEERMARDALLSFICANKNSGPLQDLATEILVRGYVATFEADWVKFNDDDSASEPGN